MSTLDSRAPVVVGVDGSVAGDDALGWAVAEASDTHRPLRIVHVLDGHVLEPSRGQPVDNVLDDIGSGRTGETDDPDGAAARTVLARAALRAHVAAPDLEIISTAVIGATVPALLGQAEGAELLVVGHHDHGSRGGRAGGRRAGSVALAMTARASCPVIVVHARHDGALGGVPAAVLGGVPRAFKGPETGRVVVASDGSAGAAAAIRFAFAVAARRRIGLTVLRAWTPPFAGYPRMVLGLPQLVRAQRQQLLADLSGDQSAFPDVEVEPKLVRDKHNHHGRALIEESESATLVVLGYHSHSGLVGLLTDATCQAVLEHARCPVAVVKLRAASTAIATQPRLDPRTEPAAHPPAQPSAQLTAARTPRTPSAAVRATRPSEDGARGGYTADDVPDDAADRPTRSPTTGSAVGEVTAVLRWLHASQPTEVIR